MTGFKLAAENRTGDITSISAEEQVLEEGRRPRSLDECDIEEDSLTPRSPGSSRRSGKTALRSQTAHKVHQKAPILKRFPSFVILPITILIIVNFTVWAIVGIVLRYHPYSPACYHGLID